MTTSEDLMNVSLERLDDIADDPFDEGKGANRRSDSVKRARAHSVPDENNKPENSAASASPADLPIPPGPTHYGHITTDKTFTSNNSEKTKHRPMKSLHLDKKVDTNQSPVEEPEEEQSSENQSSVHNLTATSPVSPQGKQFPPKQILTFCDMCGEKEPGSPVITPSSESSTLYGFFTPIQATSSPQDPCTLTTNSLGSSLYHGTSQEEYEAVVKRVSVIENRLKTEEQKHDKIESRITKTEQAQHTLLEAMNTLTHVHATPPNYTEESIIILNIYRGMTVAKNEKCAFINSAPFYTKDSCGGYKMCLRIYLKGNGEGKDTHLSAYLVIMKGEHDHIKEISWPFDRKVTFKLINHSAQGGKDIVKSFYPGVKSRDPAFQRPRSVMNVPVGFPRFVHRNILFHGGYIENDSILFKVIVDPEVDEYYPQPPVHAI